MFPEFILFEIFDEICKELGVDDFSTCLNVVKERGKTLKPIIEKIIKKVCVSRLGVDDVHKCLDILAQELKLGEKLDKFSSLTRERV